VTCIDFSPIYPYNYAVTSSTRVIIFDAHTRKPVTTLSRFKDKAYSGTFRIDGKLLVAGGESGIVQVWDFSCHSVVHGLPTLVPLQAAARMSMMQLVFVCRQAF
jgi:U3 small nucleolar RNA-associated protein 15